MNKIRFAVKVWKTGGLCGPPFLSPGFYSWYTRSTFYFAGTVQSAVCVCEWIKHHMEVFSGWSLLLCCSDVRVYLMDCCQHVVFIVYTVSLWLSLSIVFLIFLLLFNIWWIWPLLCEPARHWGSSNSLTIYKTLKCCTKAQEPTRWELYRLDSFEDISPSFCKSSEDWRRNIFTNLNVNDKSHIYTKQISKMFQDNISLFC